MLKYILSISNFHYAQIGFSGPRLVEVILDGVKYVGAKIELG